MSDYRSFRLYRFSPPEKTVSDYSEAEREAFREQFKPAAKNYKVTTRIFISIGIVFFVGFFISEKNNSLLSYLMPWLFLGYIVVFISFLLVSSPVCPACKRKVDDRIETFCPECGGRVRPRSFLKSAQCLSCGEDLWRGRRRSFRIRCCTHCGVFLDVKGL
jgi:hypothetical protein